MDNVKPLIMAGALLLGGCAATAQPASLPIELPRIVDSPEPTTCTADDLQRVSPWIGKITHREAGSATGWQPARVREQWAICGQLDQAACTRWAEAAAAKRAERDGLVAEVLPATRTVGRLWTFEIGERLESRLFRNNGAASAFLRARRADEPFLFLTSQKAVEPRNYRLEIVYREPHQKTPYATSRWTWEVPRSVAAASDALLALEDLEAHGIHISNAWNVRRSLEDATGAEVRPVAGPVEADGPPIEVEVNVYCNN